MTIKTKILISCLLILLCAGMIGYGALQHFANGPSGQEDEAAKLTELEAALINAASTSGAKCNETVTEQRTRSSQPPKSCST